MSFKRIKKSLSLQPVVSSDIAAIITIQRHNNNDFLIRLKFMFL